MMMDVFIKITNLSVSTKDGLTLVEPITLSLQSGQNLTILGETGSGKSLLAQAIMGALPKDLIIQGQIIINGELLHDNQGSLDRQKFAHLWGKTIAMLPQEPVLSLDPP